MKALLCWCAALLACSKGLGESVSLVSVADTTISEQNQAHTSSVDATMIVGRLTSNGLESKCRALLRFDLSGIPSNATITSASLTVFVSKSHLGNLDAHAIHRLTIPWTEDGATWDSTGTGPWSGGSFEEDPDATAALGGTGTFSTFPSTSAMIATTQGWLTNSAANNGWVLRNEDEETPGNARRISARGTSLEQPTLAIQYTTAPVPLDILIASPRRTTNQFTFSFAGGPGHSYTVEYKDNLNASNWTTHVVFPAPAQPTNVTVLDSLNGNRFFRVRAD